MLTDRSTIYNGGVMTILMIDDNSDVDDCEDIDDDDC